MALVSTGKDRVRTDRLNTLEYELVQKIYKKNFAFTEKLYVLDGGGGGKLIWNKERSLFCVHLWFRGGILLAQFVNKQQGLQERYYLTILVLSPCTKKDWLTSGDNYFTWTEKTPPVWANLFDHLLFVCPSINFSYFCHFLQKNCLTWSNRQIGRTWNHSLPSNFNWKPLPYPKGDNSINSGNTFTTFYPKHQFYLEPLNPFKANISQSILSLKKNFSSFEGSEPFTNRIK